MSLDIVVYTNRRNLQINNDFVYWSLTEMVE